MCPGEMSAYSDKNTCMYWDEATMQYSADGCTTEHSDSAKYVTCRCNHLTSFVVENTVKDEEPPSTTTGVATTSTPMPLVTTRSSTTSEMSFTTTGVAITSTPMPSAVKDEEPPYPRPTECSLCPVGKFQTKPCSHTVDPVCEECPSNSTSLGVSNSVTNCTCLPGHEGYKGEACTVCAAGKFKYAGEGACETCPSLTTSTMGAGNRSACLCIKAYTGPAGGTCTICPAGTYNAQEGGACIMCPNGTYQPDEGQDSVDSCLAIVGDPRLLPAIIGSAVAGCVLVIAMSVCMWYYRHYFGAACGCVERNTQPKTRILASDLASRNNLTGLDPPFRQDLEANDVYDQVTGPSVCLPAARLQERATTSAAMPPIHDTQSGMCQELSVASATTPQSALPLSEANSLVNQEEQRLQRGEEEEDTTSGGTGKVLNTPIIHPMDVEMSFQPESLAAQGKVVCIAISIYLIDRCICM